MNEENLNLPNQTVSNQQPSQPSMGSQAVQDEQSYETLPSEQREGSKTSSFFKAIPFEVLFVGIVIVILFGTLNYFNILPISELWPTPTPTPISVSVIL